MLSVVLFVVAAIALIYQLKCRRHDRSELYVNQVK